jgi:hypothetical protein
MDSSVKRHTVSVPPLPAEQEPLVGPELPQALLGDL